MFLCIEIISNYVKKNNNKRFMLKESPCTNCEKKWGMPLAEVGRTRSCMDVV